MIDQDLEMLKILKTFFEQSLKATVTITDKAQMALVTIEQLRPEIIILDLFLGSENGLTLLKEIKSNPYTKPIPVIILTANKDMEVLKTALSYGARDFIIKPPKTEVLVQRITKYYNEYKTSATHEIHKASAKPLPSKPPAIDPSNPLASAMQKLSSMLSREELEIPVLPKIALDIQNKLKNSQADMTEVGNMIRQDIAISAKVLKVSNSSYYCSASKITDIHQAILRLGVTEIKKIIQLIALKQIFKTSNPRCTDLMLKLWEHSLACALCNQIIARKDPSCDHDQYFMLGLFHDVGKIFLFHLISKAIEENNAFSTVFTEEIINKILSNMHNKLGESMIRKWNYPEEFCDVVRNHNSSLEIARNSKQILTTFFSNLLTRKAGLSLLPYEGSEDLLLQAANLLNLGDQIDTIVAELKTRVEQIREMFHE